MAPAMVAHMGLALDDARPGDQEKLALADVNRPDFKGVAHESDSTLRAARFYRDNAGC
jgi:hypothetical protein